LNLIIIFKNLLFGMSDMVSSLLESVGQQMKDTASATLLLDVVESYQKMCDSDAQRLLTGLRHYLEFRSAITPDHDGTQIANNQKLIDELLKVLKDPSHKITGINVVAMLSYLFHLQREEEFKTERIKKTLENLPENRGKGNPSGYLATLNNRGLLEAKGSKGEHKTFWITVTGIEQAQELLSEYLES